MGVGGVCDFTLGALSSFLPKIGGLWLWFAGSSVPPATGGTAFVVLAKLGGEKFVLVQTGSPGSLSAILFWADIRLGEMEIFLASFACWGVEGVQTGTHWSLSTFSWGGSGL